MSNMSYCRFNNTALDLQDCIDSIHEGVESNEEARKRKQLLDLCREFIEVVENDSTLEEDVQNCTLRNEDGDLIDDDGNRIDENGKVIEEDEDNG